jgi:DNA-binding beta-propeller fold protein YncE
LGTFKVGLGPLGIAFDGTNIWTANGNDDTVSKLRASDGKLLGTFPAAGGPYGIAFDGTNIWLSGDAYVIELRASDGVQIGFWSPGPTTGIGFDGANVWVSVLGDNSVAKM